MKAKRILFVASLLFFGVSLLSAKPADHKRNIVFTTVGDSDVDKERFKPTSAIMAALGEGYRLGYNKDNKECFIKSIKHIDGQYIITPTADIVRFWEFFAGMENLETITIPEGVEEITSDAFNNCKELKKITFPSTLKTIGACFNGCEKLVVDDIPSSVTEIRSGAFNGITIANAHFSDVGSLNEGAFMGATFINVNLPSSFNEYAFKDAKFRSLRISEETAKICKVLAEADTVYIQLGTQSINLEVGYKSVIHNLFIPSSITPEKKSSIHDGIIDNVFFEEGLETIPASLLTRTKIKRVQLPNSVRVIGDNAFAECSNLEEVAFPEGLREIEERSFYNCFSLKSIEIPNSVETIGDEAFHSCHSVTVVELPVGINKISKDCFSSCSELTQIIIPEGVTLIDDNAFRFCTNLSKVDLPSTIQEIGVRSFEGCRRLSEINFPEGLLKIGQGAFLNCSSLKEVVFPSSLHTLGGGAFWNCDDIVPIGINEKLRNSNTFPPDPKKTAIYVGTYRSGSGTLYHIIDIGPTQFTFRSASGARMETGFVRDGVLYSVAGDELGAVDTKDGKYVVFQGITLYRDK